MIVWGWPLYAFVALKDNILKFQSSFLLVRTCLMLLEIYELWLWNTQSKSIKYVFQGVFPSLPGGKTPREQKTPFREQKTGSPMFDKLLLTNMDHGFPRKITPLPQTKGGKAWKSPKIPFWIPNVVSTLHPQTSFHDSTQLWDGVTDFTGGGLHALTRCLVYGRVSRHFQNGQNVIWKVRKWWVASGKSPIRPCHLWSTFGHPKSSGFTWRWVPSVPSKLQIGKMIFCSVMAHDWKTPGNFSTNTKMFFQVEDCTYPLGVTFQPCNSWLIYSYSWNV